MAVSSRPRGGGSPLLEPEEDVEAVEEERIARLEELVSGLVSVVEGYSAGLSGYEARLGEVERFVRAASMIGSWKMSRCAYFDRGSGRCRLWRLSGEAAGQLGGVAVEDSGVYRVAVSRAPWFCGLCPLYKPAREA